ncbi:FKBP-type peptidyl-prolyl cis-trans isomerase [Thermoplasma volcanium]|uniref:FKBP-type peptidyl-prolyl cis-trans isomerase n=1 Tax=Thermoplasma volcanium TaxID=50339 RepID=UPI0012EA689F|nr:peptidylprolyl isomerase [Thermoplasma volcanium]
MKCLNTGDFIKIEYEMRVGDDKKLVATSKEELAKENNIYDEKQKYGDIVVIVGQEGLFKEINESFKNAQVGQELEVEIPPEDAFGQRLPSNIKVHTMREFQRLNIDPRVGMEVEINRKIGRIISVTPGRVLVDYNHKWAGKKVYYKYKINGTITDTAEKVKAIIANNYDPEGFNVSVDDSIRIEIPENAKFSVAWLDAKYTIVNTARKYIPGLDILITEKYEKGKGEEQNKTETTAEQPAAEQRETPAEAKGSGQEETNAKN